MTLLLDPHTLSQMLKFSECQNSIKKKQMFPYVFLNVLKYFAVSKSMNKVSYGWENPEIMKILGFGLSNDKIEKLLIRIEAE